MARRSDPFNMDDWEFRPDGSYRAKYKDADLDWLIRQYPQWASELRRIDAEGRGLTPLTVIGLDPSRQDQLNIQVAEKIVVVPADNSIRTQSDADIELPGGFKFKFKDIDWKLIVLVIVIFAFATYWVKF